MENFSWSLPHTQGLSVTLWAVCVCAVLACSVMSDSATLWTVARQAPLSMGILQARMLEGVTMPSFRRHSQPRDRTWVSHTAGRFFTIWATRRSSMSSTELHKLNHSTMPVERLCFCSKWGDWGARENSILRWMRENIGRNRVLGSWQLGTEQLLGLCEVLSWGMHHRLVGSGETVPVEDRKLLM